MKRKGMKLACIAVLALVLGACQGTSEETAAGLPPTEEPQVVVVVVTDSPEPTQTPPPLTGPRATAAALSAGVTISPSTPVADVSEHIDPEDYEAMVGYAWSIVNDNYVRDNFNGADWEAIRATYLELAQGITSQEGLWDLLDEMVAELQDHHSRFVRPEDFALEFDALDPTEALADYLWTGLDIWPAREDEHIFVWDICQYGPAAEAGLEPGDWILAVNGEPLDIVDGEYDSTLTRAAQIATEGSVELLVQEGPGVEPRTINLTYGGVGGCPGWQFAVLSLDPYIGYIRVPDFGGDTATIVLDALEEFETDETLDGLVVDVRHNPGGNSDSTIKIFASGEFGLVGPLREDGTQTIYRIRGPVAWNETTPMVVLTDGSSHSAAEYFATAMQQSGRAVLMGMPTAGNTEGITGFSLPDGSLIRLAVMTLELPDGTTLEGVGVVPDIEVPLGDWGRRGGDVQIQAALQYLLDN
ncbi:MAG: hypothetical protein JXA97_13075 [Anaerolineales bacterium]|nr:hypothetical protein [Anaerolineales bacterium]